MYNEENEYCILDDFSFIKEESSLINEAQKGSRIVMRTTQNCVVEDFDNHMHGGTHVF